MNDAPHFKDSFWKDVAKTKREIKLLSKELEKKKHILAIYYEGVRQYFEEEDVVGNTEWDTVDEVIYVDSNNNATEEIKESG